MFTASFSVLWSYMALSRTWRRRPASRDGHGKRWYRALQPVRSLRTSDDSSLIGSRVSRASRSGRGAANITELLDAEDHLPMRRGRGDESLDSTQGLIPESPLSSAELQLSPAATQPVSPECMPSQRLPPLLSASSSTARLAQLAAAAEALGTEALGAPSPRDSAHSPDSELLGRTASAEAACAAPDLINLQVDGGVQRGERQGVVAIPPPPGSAVGSTMSSTLSAATVDRGGGEDEGSSAGVSPLPREGQPA